MRRFYLETIAVGSLMLDGEQGKHARKSLRLNPGDAVEVFDGQGHVGRGVIVEARRDVVLEIETVEEVARARPRVVVASAVPKGDRAGTLVEKISELGADVWVPLITEYSVVDPRAGKMERFRRIAVESAKQCERSWLLEVRSPTTFQAFLEQFERSDAAMRLFCDVCESFGQKNVVDFGLDDNCDIDSSDWKITGNQNVSTVVVMVGPEGGWSGAEREAARKAGWKTWQFAPHVLRVETAAIAATALVKSRFTEIG